MGMHDGASGFSSVLGDVVITALFDDEDRVSGGSGCNRYRAIYTISESGLSIGAPAGTRMMCPDPLVMEQESRYLGWLPRVARHRLSVGSSGRTLDLHDSEELRILQFVEEF
jgi:heat shock protein HslJ